MIRAADFRAAALALEGAEEQPHHDRASFRINGKIFATLAEEKRLGVVKLILEDQAAQLAAEPETFRLVGWQQQGWLGIDLDRVEPSECQALLEAAWRNVG